VHPDPGGDRDWRRACRAGVPKAAAQHQHVLDGEIRPSVLKIEFVGVNGERSEPNPKLIDGNRIFDAIAAKPDSDEEWLRQESPQLWTSSFNISFSVCPSSFCFR